MKIEKIHLDDMKRCYCASNVNFDNENHILLASEDPDTACTMYSGKKFEEKEMVWKHPGGCMSIIPVPGKKKEVLAVQEFYLKVSPSNSKLVWGKYNDHNEWEFKDLLSLQYCHRFDIYNKDGVNYLIVATIATTKKDKADWSVPGRIYVGILPDDLNEEIHLTILQDNLFRNHGYWHGKENGQDVGYFGSDQGILKVKPLGNNKWEKEFILEGKIGEVAAIDIDSDGDVEIMTIEEFHGDTIKIYKKIEGKYQEVYRYANKIDFAHTLVGAKLGGKNTFLAGVRREEAELFYVQYENGKFKTVIIEKGIGPANLCVVNEKDRDLIIAANHTKNEAAVYIVNK